MKGCPARWYYSQLVSFAYDTRIELVNSNGHLRGKQSQERLVPRRDFTLVPRIPLRQAKSRVSVKPNERVSSVP